MDNYIATEQSNNTPPSLPKQAYLPINRCNLPAVILGSLTYQRHPVPLSIDGVADIHTTLWSELDKLHNKELRCAYFSHYMDSAFQLQKEKKFGAAASGKERINATYLSMLRGWFFNPNSREGAVLKGWCESRFGLIPRWHHGSIPSVESKAYLRYLHERTSGIYNTNALESQLDLVYSYCQYELAKHYPDATHIRLYRGFNKLSSHEIQHQFSKRRYVVLLNNINSFSDSSDMAGQFGDYVMQADIPLPRVCMFPKLLGNLFGSEGEHIVLGGICEMSMIAP